MMLNCNWSMFIAGVQQLLNSMIVTPLSRSLRNLVVVPSMLPCLSATRIFCLSISLS